MNETQSSGRHVELPTTPEHFRAANLIKNNTPQTPPRKAPANRRSRVKAAAGAVVLTLVTAGCAFATPDTSQVAIDYTGGPFEGQEFNKCVDPGIRDQTNLFGYVYYYPAGTRTWDFSNRPGADSPPILVSTSNNQELIVSGTITFTLDTSCEEYTDAAGTVWPGGKLQKFNDTIGRGKGAYFGEDSTQIPQGWRDVLGLYLGGPAERAMDSTGGGFTWQDLYSRQDVAAQFTEAVTAQIPTLLSEQTGGENFFEIISIQIDKPTVPDALRNELQSREAALLSQATANDQLAFANGFPGGLSGYQAYLEQQARTKCYNDGRCIYVPDGVAVAAGPVG